MVKNAANTGCGIAAGHCGHSIGLRASSRCSPNQAAHTDTPASDGRSRLATCLADLNIA
jgi:hypothetical protein